MIRNEKLMKGTMKNIFLNNTGSSLCKFRRSGFTLIEILIAVAILSVVLAALYSTFFLSQRAVAVVDDSLIRLQESRGLVDILKREIESSCCWDRLGQGDKYTVFLLEDRDYYGRQASRLSFSAFSSLQHGLARLDYSVEEDKGKMILKKSIVSAFREPEDIKRIELIEDIESFTVEARYKNAWVKTWDSELNNAVPDEIRISLVMHVGDKGRQIMISDIAKPRIGKKLIKPWYGPSAYSSHFGDHYCNGSRIFLWCLHYLRKSL
jgi:general secretion pathway protein J